MESALWTTFRKHLSPLGVLKRVENRVEEGMPDVCYCLRRVTGWVELKHLDRLPVHPATTVLVDHLTLEQVAWIEEWTNGGGRAWLLLQAGRTYSVLGPAGARALFERRLTTARLKDRAAWHGVGFNRVAILDMLTRADPHAY